MKGRPEGAPCAGGLEGRRAALCARAVSCAARAAAAAAALRAALSSVCAARVLSPRCEAAAGCSRGREKLAGASVARAAVQSWERMRM